MFNPSTNFIGKDPMQWWIGQVTDPDKGKWGDSLEKAKAENPDEDIYTFRYKIPTDFAVGADWSGNENFIASI